MEQKFIDQWNETFERVLDFVVTHQRLPKSTDVFEGVNLFNFLQVAAHRKPHGSDTKEYKRRRKLARALGIKDTIPWEDNFAALEEYVKITNKLPKVTEEFNGYPIGAFVAAQRGFFRNGLLKKEREESLRNLGVSFEYTRKGTKKKERVSWETRFGEVLDVVDKTGALTTLTNNYTLARWVENNSVALVNGKLNEKRSELFSNLVGDYRPPSHEDSWLHSFRRFVSLYDRRNDLTEKELTTYESYIARTHRASNAGKLSEFRVKTLSNFGFFEKCPYRPMHDKWKLHLECVKDFYQDHGHIPSRKDHPSLGMWVHRLLCSIAYDTIPKWKIDSLKENGFIVVRKDSLLVLEFVGVEASRIENEIAA